MILSRSGLVPTMVTAGVCVLLLADAAGQMPVSAAASQPDTLRTILKGWDYRVSLLRTFEGYAEMKRFYGPRREIREGGIDAKDSVQVLFYTVERPRDQWLCERRQYHQEPSGVASEVAHDVTVLNNQGVWGTKQLDVEDRWRVATTVGFDWNEELLTELLLTPILPPEFAPFMLQNLAITKEELDGAECIRLQFGGEVPSHPGARTYGGIMWIDPDKGCAIRKWVEIFMHDGRIVSDHIRHGYDFREYAPGLWLPRRVQSVRCRVPEGQSVPVLDRLTIWEILEAKVNQPLSEHFWEPLAFDDEHPTTPYEPRLVDDTLVEIEVADAEGAPVENESEKPVHKEVKLKEIIDRLLKELAEGPGDPATFMELLPELTEEFQ